MQVKTYLLRIYVLSIRFVILSDISVNPGFKLTTCFTNAATTTASASKFKYQGKFQIFRSRVLMWKKAFDFERRKN